MMESYYAGAYWLGRKETAEACAQRAETFFRLLARVDPTWTHWFETGWSRKQALNRPIVPTVTTFLRLFIKKENQQLEDGFRLWTWNGEQQGDATGINFSCGSSSDYTSNVCVFNPPRKGPVAERVLTAQVLTEVLRAMAVAWDPEWGIATSYTHQAEVLKRAKMGTFAGWVTYIPFHRGQLPPLSAPVRVEPVEDKGTLIILTPERFTASNPAHVELAALVRERLDRAGLLGPLRPAASP